MATKVLKFKNDQTQHNVSGKIYSYFSRFSEGADNMPFLSQRLRINGSVQNANNVTNHNFTKNLPLKITEAGRKELNKSGGHYMVEPNFNYLSNQWEDFFELKSELDIPSVYTESIEQYGLSSHGRAIINRQKVEDYDKLLRNNFVFKSSEDLQKSKNFLFGKGYDYKAKNSLRKVYPFYNKVELKHYTSTLFRNKMIDLGIYELFIEDYIQSPKESITIDSKSYVSYDIGGWIENTNFELNNNNIAILSDSFVKPTNFFYKLKKLNFYGFLRKVAKDKLRSFEEIQSGKECYNEVMFYKIDKRASSTNQLIQSYWVPADDNGFRLIDTQIKYGQEYVYNCFAYVVVVGSDYSLRKQGRGNIYNFNNSPSIKLIELPLFNEYGTIIQPPQPEPDLYFYNNKYNMNEIQLSMKLNTNNYNKPFIEIQPNDSEQDVLIDSYNRNKNKKYFQFEKEHALFEVYRLDFHPRSYQDFNGNKLADIKNQTPSISAILKDFISLEKDYYYTIRSVNSHGLYSNPTPVFKVRLTRDADESFMFVETVEFFKQESYETDRLFSSRIQLIPASQHTVLDEQQEATSGTTLKGVIDKVNLGIVDNKIWGKRFKFRFTSTDTGKKIDLNLNVRLIKKKTEEDF